jgi:ATP-dependent Clp protease ATP-binding subunit ClpA
VQAENYEEAKRLKQTIESLTAVGSQIAKLEAKKQQAVATEDYDEAKKIKDQIDRLRGQYAPKPPAPKMEAPKSRLPYQQQPQPAYEDEYDDAPMKVGHLFPCFFGQSYDQFKTHFVFRISRCRLSRSAVH